MIKIYTALEIIRMILKEILIQKITTHSFIIDCFSRENIDFPVVFFRFLLKTSLIIQPAAGRSIVCYPSNQYSEWTTGPLDCANNKTTILVVTRLQYQLSIYRSQPSHMSDYIDFTENSVRKLPVYC